MNNEINARLAALLAQVDEPRLRTAMEYALLGGGKRIRPRLLLASCEAACGKYDAIALDFACALEMIHAYSLIHDDLPAMDDDTLRRGKPTVHIQFDEATAILAGDALLNYAYEIMARLCAENPRARKPTYAMAVMAKAAGPRGMIGGQMLDLQSEGKAIYMDTLRAIHRRKTGALFAAATEAGSLLGGASPLFIRRIVKLGQLTGMLFQVKDDILDETSTAEQLGKHPGSDVKNKKNTYVSLLGPAEAAKVYEGLCLEVRALTVSIPCRTNTLSHIIESIIEREF